MISTEEVTTAYKIITRKTPEMIPKNGMIFAYVVIIFNIK